MKYYIIAGEASGDLHGSNLMKEILQADPQAEIRFWGGDLMHEVKMHHTHPEKIEQVKHIKELAFMGFVEVVGHLPTVLGNMRFCKRDIAEYAPDVMVFIDYPGFNLKIARYTHKQGIKNVYYISPQIWAWKTGRIKSMRRDLDRLCYILPTEQKFYAEHHFEGACYVGHPLLDAIEHYKKESDRDPLIGAEEQGKPVIALLPGSRKQELKRMLPLMDRLASEQKEYSFVMAGMSLIGKDFYRKHLQEGSRIEVLYDRTYDILSKAYAAVVCSGTATLETALFRVPEVVCYQCNKISAAIARPLISRRIRFISLVNLIADKAVVTELIQSDYNAERLGREFAKITADSENRTRILSEYDQVIESLGGSGASKRAAHEIIHTAQQ